MVEIGDIVRLLGDAGLPDPTGSETVAREFRERLFTFIAGTMEGEGKCSDYLRASGLYKVCARREAIFCVHPSMDTGPRKQAVGLQLTFDMGKAIHDTYQNRYLGPMGVLWGDWFCFRCDCIVHRGTMPKRCPKCDAGRSALTFYEMSLIDHELRITAHPDGLLVDRPDAPPRMVAEVKSVSSYQYRETRKNGPQQAHVIQAHAYMRLLKIDEALIIYADKGKQADWTFAPDGITAGTPHVNVFHIHFDHTYWAKVEQRIREFWRAQSLMARDEAPTDDDVMTFCRVCEDEFDDLARECPARVRCFKLEAP